MSPKTTCSRKTKSRVQVKASLKITVHISNSPVTFSKSGCLNLIRRLALNILGISHSSYKNKMVLEERRSQTFRLPSTNSTVLGWRPRSSSRQGMFEGPRLVCRLHWVTRVTSNPSMKINEKIKSMTSFYNFTYSRFFLEWGVVFSVCLYKHLFNLKNKCI